MKVVAVQFIEFCRNKPEYKKAEQPSTPTPVPLRITSYDSNGNQ